MSEHDLALAGGGFDRLMGVDDDEQGAAFAEPDPVETDSTPPPAAEYPAVAGGFVGYGL